MLSSKLYLWMATAPGTDADLILSEALAHAEPEYAARLIATLLRRRTDVGWANLVARYDELPPESRAKLLESGDLMSAAVARAMRSVYTEERCNALRACEDLALPKLSYLLPNLLRDASPKVRDLAVQVLVRTATVFLERAAPGRGAPLEQREAHAAEYEQLVKAIVEALQTFEFHLRVEVIEVATWFGRRLSDLIWERLDQQRSRARAVIENHLPLWNKPWMAAFLLLSLRQRDWRRYALRALRSWTDAPHVVALLREAELLEDPAVRAGLRSLRSPQLYSALVSASQHESPELQAAACRWVACLGFTEQYKLDFLAPRLASSTPVIRRAAVYSLIALDTPQAMTLLQNSASGDSAEAVFARWFLRGRREMSQRRDDAAAEETLPAGASALQVALWRDCRRTPPAERWPLVEVIRNDIDQWRNTLRQQLNSPDPRDRVLVVQTVGTPELLPDFADDLQRLRQDPVESIRNVVVLLLSRLPRYAESASSADEPASGAAENAHEADALSVLSDAASDVQAAREELDALLTELMSSGSPQDDESLAQRVGILMKQARIGVEEPRPAAGEST